MARLKLSRVALACGLMAGAGAACADPISLIATAIVYAGSFTGIAALAIIAAGSLLSSTLASNQAKRRQAEAAAAQRSQFNASLQDRNVTGLSAEASWQVVYGNPAPVGGSIVAILSSGSKDEFKHLVIAFAAHPSQSIDEIYLDGTPVGALDANGWSTAGDFYESRSDPSASENFAYSGGTPSFTLSRPPTSVISLVNSAGQAVPFTTSGRVVTVAVDQPDAAGTLFTVTFIFTTGTARVNIQKHLSPGGVDTVDAFLVGKTSSWTAADKLSGYTYAVITLDQNFQRFQGGPPSVSARISGKNTIYDFRTGAYGYSNNPALCLADFIMSEAGYGATIAQFDTASVIAAANACDVHGAPFFVPFLGIFVQPMLTCDGAFRTEQARESTKQSLEDSFGGTCHQSGGVWRISPGAWTTPVMSLTDADCAAPIQINQASYNSKERYNTVRGKYIDGSRLGVATDFTPHQNNAYVATDGLVKVKDITLPFTSSHQRALDLARMIVERSRGGLTITYPGHMRLWPLQPGDRVSVTNAEFGWIGKTFRVTDWAFHPRTPVALTMVEDVAAYYDNAAILTVDAAPNTNLPSPFATQNLTDLRAASGTDQLIKQSDGTITTRVAVFWAAATSSYILQGGQVQVQTRPATSTDADWKTETLPGSETATFLERQADGAMVLIRARFVNELAIAGLWQTITHTVIGKTEPPPDVQTFTIDGNRLTWSKVSAIDLAGYEIRFNYGSNIWWDSATPIQTGVITDSPYIMSQKLQGVVTLLIKAIDTTKNYSTKAASVVLNLGSPIVSNLFLTEAKGPLFSGVITGGSVSGSAIRATATDVFFTAPTEPMFSPDTSYFFPPGSYATMTYTWSIDVSAVGLLLLDSQVSAGNYQIEYQRGDQGSMFGASLDFMFSPGTDPMFGMPSPMVAWPGSLNISATEKITFRITTLGGATQGIISQATVKIDVPDVLESFNDLVISAAGTRLPITQIYRVIENIQMTVQQDGNGGVSVRIEDKNAKLGPLIRVLNTAGSPVAGLIDVEIQGY